MRKILFVTLLLCMALSAAKAQDRPYEGKLVILFRDTVKGKFILNMHGTNHELVEVTTVNMVRNKNRQAKQKITAKAETVKLNAALISNVMIGKDSYKFRDLKDDYGDSMIRRNCLAKRIAGTDTMGLFEFVNEAGISSYYLQGPKDGAVIYNIAHPYVAGDFTSFSLLRFYKCEFVRQKIKAKDHDYFYEETGSSLADKLQVWRNILDVYYKECARN